MNKTDNAQVATKKDLKNLATKDDLKKFATKSELKQVEKSLRGEILRVEVRIENIEEGQKRMESTLNKVSIQLDGFVGRVDGLTEDNEIGANQIHELRKDVDKHEKRIEHLESSTPTT